MNTGQLFSTTPPMFHLAKQLRIGQNHLCTRRPRRSFNSGPMEAPLRLVAAHIGNDDALCARLPALAHHLGHEFWIGVGSLLRRAIPRDVGLDHHNVLTAR